MEPRAIAKKYTQKGFTLVELMVHRGHHCALGGRGDSAIYDIPQQSIRTEAYVNLNGAHKAQMAYFPEPIITITHAAYLAGTCI